MKCGIFNEPMALRREELAQELAEVAETDNADSQEV